MSLWPRTPAHRGSVRATGFAIDPALVGLVEARRRILAAWLPGAVVIEAEGLVIIEGLRATRVRAERAPGAPLVEVHGVISTAPLEADEVAALALPPRSLVIARGGEVRAVSMTAGRVDVATWIDLDDHELDDVVALAEPPPVAVVANERPTGDVRAILGIGGRSAAAAEAGAGGDAAADGDAAVRAAVVRALAGAPPTTTGAESASGAAWVRVRRGLMGMLARILGAPAAPAGEAVMRRRVAGPWWRRLWSRRAGSDRALPPSGGGPQGDGDGDAEPEPPEADAGQGGWLERLRGRVARAVWESRIGQQLGRRQARYLSHMLELFDRGDLDEALRHAIPMGGGGDAGGRLDLSAPRPRDDVRLSMTARPGRSSLMPVSEDASAQIRARYRAALERLERLGRIEEAAYVLAELLGDVAAAIALLERHGQYALAARLAEGRQQAPALIVRLWFLAGDRERAVAVARRHQAWAAAIGRLEQDGAGRAAALRLLWADHLAQVGDYVQAVDVAWPVADARDLALAWIDRGIAVGGSAAARLLVRKLGHLPASFPAVAPEMLSILDDPDDDAVWRRVALIEALVAESPTSEIRTIARAAARAVIRDLGRGADGEAPTFLPRLMRLADDAALRADQPVIPAGLRPQSLVDRGVALERRWPAGDAGAVAVHDAAALPGGRVLVALGELGVRILGRDGRVVRHIDQPAAQLVVSDHGTRALALIQRGEVQRIARLDLADGRGRWWCDARVDRVLSTYDGDSWWVAVGRELLAIDTTADRWKATWGVDTILSAKAMARDGDLLAVSIGDALWSYQGFTLRQRKSLSPHLDHAARRALMRHLAPRPAAADTVEAVYAANGEQPDPATGSPRLETYLLSSEGEIGLPPGMPTGLEVGYRFAAVAQRVDDGMVVTAAYLPRRAVIARLALDGAQRVSMRLAELALTVGDDRGRVIVIDLRTGTARRDLRLTP